MKLLSSTEIKRVIAAARKAGLEFGAVDIRADGITLHPPTEQRESNAYDDWKQSESRSARR